MKFYVYSIRDELTGFMTPVIEQSDAVAMRNFQMAIDSQRRDSSVMAFRPSEFTLYCLGSFDSQSGVISPATPPSLVCSGSSFSEVKK